MGTLPFWALKHGMRLDIVRKLLKQRPELRTLGQTFGATRIYSEAESLVIRAAYEGRPAAAREAVGS